MKTYDYLFKLIKYKIDLAIDVIILPTNVYIYIYLQQTTL